LQARLFREAACLKIATDAVGNVFLVAELPASRRLHHVKYFRYGPALGPMLVDLNPGTEALFGAVHR